MKKSILPLIAFITLVAFSVSAQVKVGFVAAYQTDLNSAGLSAQPLNHRKSSPTLALNTVAISPQFGVAMEYTQGVLFLRAEATYFNQQNSFEFSKVSGSESGQNFLTEDITIAKDYVSIPVTAGILINKTKLGAGVTYNAIINSDINVPTETNMNYLSTNSEIGFNAFAAYKLTNNVSVHVRYEAPFGTLTNGFRYENKPVLAEARTSRITLGAGFLF